MGATKGQSGLHMPLTEETGGSKGGFFALYLGKGNNRCASSDSRLCSLSTLVSTAGWQAKVFPRISGKAEGVLLNKPQCLTTYCVGRGAEKVLAEEYTDAAVQ